MPPAVHSVRRIACENQTATATSAASSAAVASTNGHGGSMRPAETESRNRVAARTSPLRASGHSVNTSAVSAP